MPLIIITGPAGCGKTRNRDLIRTKFKASMVIDSGDLNRDIVFGRELVNATEQASKYGGAEPNVYFGTTIVILTNECVTMGPDMENITSCHTFRSLGLE